MNRMEWNGMNGVTMSNILNGIRRSAKVDFNVLYNISISYLIFETVYMLEYNEAIIERKRDSVGRTQEEKRWQQQQEQQ